VIDGTLGESANNNRCASAISKCGGWDVLDSQDRGSHPRIKCDPGHYHWLIHEEKMRLTSIIAFSIGLASCNSTPASKREAVTEEYVVGSYEQSLKAYQLCAAQNPDDLNKCSGLGRVMEADKRRYEKSLHNTEFPVSVLNNH